MGDFRQALETAIRGRGLVGRIQVHQHLLGDLTGPTGLQALGNELRRMRETISVMDLSNAIESIFKEPAAALMRNLRSLPFAPGAVVLYTLPPGGTLDLNMAPGRDGFHYFAVTLDDLLHAWDTGQLADKNALIAFSRKLIDERVVFEESLLHTRENALMPKGRPGANIGSFICDMALRGL